jgi:hypothetical protein
MNINKKFGNILRIIKCKEKRYNIISQLQELYDKKIINTEILLNIIKGLVLIIFYNKQKIDNYIKIFDYLLINQQKNIVSILEYVDFSQQFELDEKIIKKIVINTDIFFENYINNNIDFNILLNIINSIIKKIKKVHININLKIYLYIHFIKKANDMIINKNNINNIISNINNYIDDIIKLINYFIKHIKE